MPSATFGVWAITGTVAGGDGQLSHIQVTAGVPAIDLTVALPVTIHTNSVFQSFVRALPSDPGIVYCGLRDFAGTAYLYRYNSHTATWTLLYSQGFGINLTHVTDLVFGPGVEEVWVAVGTLNDYGESFHESNPAEDAWQGLWHSIGGAALTQVNAGHEHAFNGGNINHPNTLTGLAGGMTGGIFTVWATHCLTVGGGAGHNSVLSILAGLALPIDVEWAFLDAAGFSYCTLSPIQYHPEWSTPGIWFLMDFSGTGAYSFANSDEIISADVATYTDNLINTVVRSGACGGLWFSNTDKGFIYDTNGVKHIWQLTNRGAVITEVVPSAPQLTATRWSFAVHPSLPLGIIGYYSGTGADGQLVWTEDEGATFTSWDAPSTELYAVDFGVASPPPPAPAVYQEDMAFRDSRGFVAHARFYTVAPDPATARSQAIVIASNMQGLSGAIINTAHGPWNTQPLGPNRGSVADYLPIEERLVLTFVDANGYPISVEIPAPASATLTQAGDQVDLTNAGIITAIADLVANNLCGRGGNLAVNFLGGRRVQSRIRHRFSINQEAPSGSEPGI